MKGKRNEPESTKSVARSDIGEPAQSVAQAPSSLDIPAFLRREDTQEQREARGELTRRLARLRVVPAEEHHRVSCEADQKAIAELTDGAAAVKKAKAAARISKLLAKKHGEAAAMPLQGREAVRAIAGQRSQPGSTEIKERGIEMSQVGPKEKALRETRTTTDKRTKAQKLADACVTDLVKPVSDVTDIPWSEMVGDDLRKAEPTPASNASKKKEDVVKATAQSAAAKAVHSAGAEAMKKAREEKSKAKPTARAKVNGHARSTKAPSRMQMIEDMLLTKKGATQDECNQAWTKSGGKSTHVSLKMQLERFKTRNPKAKLVEHDGRFRLQA